MRKIIKCSFYIVRKIVKFYFAFFCLSVSAGLMLNPAPQNFAPQQAAMQNAKNAQALAQEIVLAQVATTPGTSLLKSENNLPAKVVQSSDLPVQQPQELSTEAEQPLNVASATPALSENEQNPDSDANGLRPTPLTLLPEDAQTVDDVVGISESLYGWNFNSLANDLALSPEVAEQMKTRIFDYFSDPESKSGKKEVSNFLAEIVPEFVGEDMAQQYFEQEAENKQMEAQERTIALTDAVSTPLGLAPEQETTALQIITQVDEEAQKGRDFSDTRLRESRIALLKGEIDESSYAVDLAGAKVMNQMVLEKTVNKLIDSPELNINDQQRNDLAALYETDKLTDLLTSRVCRKVDNADCHTTIPSDNS